MQQLHENMPCEKFEIYHNSNIFPQGQHHIFMENVALKEESILPLRKMYFVGPT